MTFAAYLQGVDQDEHGIAFVHFESDSKQKVMIIDKVLISPRLTPESRPLLEAAVVQSLRSLGEANEWCVRLLSEYDV